MRILVLVPSTGNLYIYMEEAIDDCEEVSSRPLHGESIYLLTMFNTMRAVKQCSRPLHGESIYLLKKDHPMPPLAFVLVPSTGNLYIYYLQERADYLSELFSSPPRGIYISTNIVHGQLCSILFSSPPRGIYISTNTCIFVHALVISSRPLHGESIYLPN